MIVWGNLLIVSRKGLVLGRGCDEEPGINFNFNGVGGGGIGGGDLVDFGRRGIGAGGGSSGRRKGAVGKSRNGASGRAEDGVSESTKWRSERMRIEDHLGKGGRVFPPSGGEKNWVVEFGEGKATVRDARLTASEDSLIFGGPLVMAVNGADMMGSNDAAAEMRVKEKGTTFSASAGLWYGPKKGIKE